MLDDRMSDKTKYLVEFIARDSAEKDTWKVDETLYFETKKEMDDYIKSDLANLSNGPDDLSLYGYRAYSVKVTKTHIKSVKGYKKGK